MIKKLLLAIAIAMPSMAFAQKFGIINTQPIIEAMPEMTEARTALETSSKKFEDEFKNLQDEANKKFTEFQSMDENTPQTIKDRRMSELQELQQKMEQFRGTAQADLQRQQEQLMGPIQQKVMTAIQAVGAEGDFTMIFENMVPIYVGKNVEDVTPLVKAKLGLK
jgi:hypothetical protein